ncbi:MAG: right-handed parallel beta-helix repeat-containing protein [Clostridia bacterium]|jgi:hypothetical protein
MGTVTKALIGEEDINFWNGDSTQTTFTRLASLGGTQTMTKVGYEVDVLRSHSGNISAALSIIGTINKTTILLRPGTYTISADTDWSAYTNVTFKIVNGAIISHGSYTVKIPNPDAGFYQWLSGSGAVTFAGNVKEVYPQWFGANGDGSTDDTTAINAALASYKIVTIPKTAATYLVTAPLTPISNQVITIEGEIKTAQPVAGAFSIFDIESKSNVKILGKGGKITGDGVTQNLRGVYSLSSSNITVTGMEITGTDFGIWFRKSTETTATENYIHNVLRFGIQVGYSIDSVYNYFTISKNRFDTINGTAIWTQYMDRGVVEGNIINGITFLSGATSGIMVYEANYVTVSGNVIYDLSSVDGVSGIVVYVGSNDTITGNTIHGVTGTDINGTDRGGALQGSICSNCVFSNNTVTGPFLQPLVINGDSKGVVISGNTFDVATITLAGHGINLTDKNGSSPSYVTVTGNTIIGKTPIGASVAAIRAGDDSTHITIANNIVDSFYYGIDVANAASYVHINNNEINSCLDGIYTEGSSNNIYIRGNYLNTFAAGGVYSIFLRGTSDYVTIYDDNVSTEGVFVDSSGTNLFWTRSATAAQLQSSADPINTKGKTVGKLVWVSDANIYVYAIGTTATAHWYDGAGVDTYTPVP